MRRGDGGPASATLLRTILVWTATAVSLMLLGLLAPSGPTPTGARVRRPAPRVSAAPGHADAPSAPPPRPARHVTAPTPQPL